MNSSGMQKEKTIHVAITRPQISMMADVTYSQAEIKGFPNKDLKMDILRPLSDHALPAVIYIPGGAFLQSNRTNNLQNRLRIAEAGFIVASIEYRTSPLSAFPAPIQDVKSAIRYLKAKSEHFGIQPDKIAVWGESAGGYLATFAGATNGISYFDKGYFLDSSSHIAAVIDCFAVSDLSKIDETYSKQMREIHYSPTLPEAEMLESVSPGADKDETHDPVTLDKANPLNYITSKTPPFLIMHGDKDHIVPIDDSKKLHAKLQEKGIESSFYIIDNAEHAGIIWEQPTVVQILIDFLNSHLK